MPDSQIIPPCFGVAYPLYLICSHNNFWYIGLSALGHDWVRGEGMIPTY